MFQGPAYGGLVAGPTAGNIQANPAELIPDNGLVIAQVHELRSQLDQKHPLVGLGDLSLVHTAGLSEKMAGLIRHRQMQNLPLGTKLVACQSTPKSHLIDHRQT